MSLPKVQIEFKKSYMNWKVGQRLVCLQAVSPTGKQSPRLTGVVQEQREDGWVTIMCPTTWIVVSRYQTQFEQDGWQLDPTLDPDNHQASVTNAIAQPTKPVGSK